MKPIGRITAAQHFNNTLIVLTEKGMFFWRDDGWVEMDLVAKDRTVEVRAPVVTFDAEPLADA